MLFFSQVARAQKVIGANGIIVHHLELQGIRGFLGRNRGNGHAWGHWNLEVSWFP